MSNLLVVVYLLNKVMLWYSFDALVHRLLKWTWNERELERVHFFGGERKMNDVHFLVKWTWTRTIHFSGWTSNTLRNEQSTSDSTTLDILNNYTFICSSLPRGHGCEKFSKSIKKRLDFPVLAYTMGVVSFSIRLRNQNAMGRLSSNYPRLDDESPFMQSDVISNLWFRTTTKIEKAFLCCISVFFSAKR